MVDIITRAGKGAPLTSVEMDANLTALKDGIESLVGLVVQSWVQDPDTYAVTFDMSDGSTIGPLALPPAPINPLGDWQATLYQRGDLVTFAGSSYLCRIASLESTDLLEELDAGSWQLIASGASSAPVVLNCTRAGALSAGKIYLFKAPVDMILERVLITLDTPPGGSNSCVINVTVNGTTVPVPIGAAFTDLEIQPASPIAAGQRLTIALAAVTGFGAAADLGITMRLSQAL